MSDFTKYDIDLDGNGYCLKPGSYSKKIIPFFADQQFQGEPSLADSSIYKFFSQTDWTGGRNKEQLITPNVFKDSYNIDINRKGGEVRLARQFSGNRLTGNSNLATTASSAVITSSGSTFQTALVLPGDAVRIYSGTDVGNYTVLTVDSETQITLTATLTATGTNISFSIYQDHPIMPFTTTAEILDSSETEIDLTLSTGIPSSGTIRIEGEEITYTGNATNTLTGCTRGANGTNAAAHSTGVNAEYVSPIVKQLNFNNLFIACVGKFIFTSADASAWTLRYTTAANIIDAVVCAGVLIVSCGTSGFYWSRTGTGTWAGTDGGNQATNANYLCSYEVGGTEYLMIAYGSVFSRATFTTGGPGSWSVTVIKTLSVDETNFLLKPVVFRGFVYVWCNRGSQTLGRADLYIYDSTNFTRYLYDQAYPKAVNMIARENELIFAEDQITGIAIKSFNGSTVKSLGIIESVPGGTMWGTVQYNTTQYGAGSELITSPFEGAEWEDRFIFSIKSTSAQNYIYTYEGQGDDGEGVFSRINLLDSLGSNYTSFSSFQKTVWIGDTKGKLRKLQNDYIFSGVLTSSELDMNLPNLKKLFVDFQILHRSLPTNCTITVDFSSGDGNFYSATAKSETGGTGSLSSEFNFANTAIPAIANGLVTEKITYKITIKGIPNDTPIIRDINIRYLVQPDKKHRWTMTIPCLDNIVLRDDTDNGFTGAFLIDQLEATLAKKTSITLIDIDQVSNTVLVDRNYHKQSWIETDSGLENGLFTISLLET